MKIRIYTMTHRPFHVPSDPMYQPLQVGRATHEDLGYPGDDTGDNISALNCFYSELTGVYWIWKNVTDVDYVGVCHYRRYLLNDRGLIFTKAELEHLLEEYDMLTSKKLTLNFSYAYGFGENHSPRDLAVADEVIRDLYPDFYPLYHKRVQENQTYFGNIMICSKQCFDAYCQFLFPVFEQMHQRLDLSSYDDYHKRLYGFLSEFLLMVWCEYQKLRIKECKVGLIGEKKETKETIRLLADYFSRKDIAGAKEYFLSVQQQRPDILMEASDIHGHLHLCLQAISTAEYEQDAYGKILLPIDLPFGELMELLSSLNATICRLRVPHQEVERNRSTAALLANPLLSDYAIAISLLLYCPVPEDRALIRDTIRQLYHRQIPDLQHF